MALGLGDCSKDGVATSGGESLNLSERGGLAVHMGIASLAV